MVVSILSVFKEGWSSNQSTIDLGCECGLSYIDIGVFVKDIERNLFQNQKVENGGLEG